MKKLNVQQIALKSGLLGYLGGKLAADSALESGEMATLIEGVTSENYHGLRDVLASTIKSVFTPRLAKDSKLDDLEELLEELEEEGEEGEELEEEDMDAYDCGPLEKALMDLEVPKEKIAELMKLVPAKADKAMDKAKDEDIDSSESSAMDEDELSKKEKKAMPEPLDNKQAMDAAIQASKSEIAALFKAAEEVAPLVGKIDALAMDSAASIYKLALDAAGVDVTGVDPSAFRAMVKLIETQKASAPAQITADAASVDSFAARYKHIPSKL